MNGVMLVWPWGIPSVVWAPVTPVVFCMGVTLRARSRPRREDSGHIGKGARHVTEPRSRGVLYPARLPSFTRVGPEGAELALIVHFWVPEWHIEPGRVSRQHVIGYPASNLAVGPEPALVSGPTTKRSHRHLTGSGCAVGSMTRPAAVPAGVGGTVAPRATEA